jgi:hypothetical protein
MLARETVVFGFTNLVESLAEVSEDVELVEQDRRLRGVLRGGAAKRLPPIHHRETNAFCPLFSEKPIEFTTVT